MSLTTFLVRHGTAGNRHEWESADHHRPLDEMGWKQARWLADLLPGRGATRVVSSPSLRCTQTVEPLAERLGVPVEDNVLLAEGADADETVALLRDLDGGAVLCSHGDNIPRVLDRLREVDDLPLPDEYPYDKGSIWVLEREGDGRFARAEYIPPLA